ncbi:DNA-binding protein [Streptomyces sp. SID8356]|nr:DNA-binding protein [Streptomyces sp. SID8356]
MEQDGLARPQRERLPLYERTRRFRSYSSALVPGLIQTRGYTEAVLRAVQRRRVDVDDVAEAVEVRMERQCLLREGGRRFSFLVEESVLRNGIGGADVLAGQLCHLLTLGSLPEVGLGVVPARADRSRTPVEGFWIFDTAQVNVELVSGYLTMTQPGEVAMYEEAFAELEESAVHGERAHALIRGALASLG